MARVFVGHTEVVEKRSKYVLICDQCGIRRPEEEALGHWSLGMTHLPPQEQWLTLTWPVFDDDGYYAWSELDHPHSPADLCSSACVTAFIAKGEEFLRDNE